MRICYIALGKFVHVDAYLDFFSKRGHDVHFVALTSGPQRQVPTKDVAVNGAYFGLCGKLTYLPAMLRARKVVRSLSPDIVHAHYATSAGLCAWVCDFHPWIVTAHGTDVTLGVKSILWRALLRELFRKADCVNPVSDGLRRMVLGLGVPENKIETLSLGIDTNAFRFAKGVASERPTALKFVCTRRFEPVYDHATLVRGLALLKARGIPFHLTLLGDGIGRGELERLIEDLGMTHQVSFLGPVLNSKLPDELAKHDIYLSASTRDGTSLSLLEAMAVGLYPIVSDIDANAEWIIHGQNGLLHGTANPQSLADCVVSFAESFARANDVLLHNRRLVVNKGDRTRNMEQLEGIYLRLVNSRNEVLAPTPSSVIS